MLILAALVASVAGVFVDPLFGKALDAVFARGGQLHGPVHRRLQLLVEGAREANTLQDIRRTALHFRDVCSQSLRSSPTHAGSRAKMRSGFSAEKIHSECLRLADLLQSPLGPSACLKQHDAMHLYDLASVVHEEWGYYGLFLRNLLIARHSAFFLSYDDGSSLASSVSAYRHSLMIGGIYELHRELNALTFNVADGIVADCFVRSHARLPTVSILLEQAANLHFLQCLRVRTDGIFSPSTLVPQLESTQNAILQAHEVVESAIIGAGIMLPSTGLSLLRKLLQRAIMIDDKYVRGKLQRVLASKCQGQLALGHLLRELQLDSRNMRPIDFTFPGPGDLRQIDHHATLFSFAFTLVLQIQPHVRQLSYLDEALEYSLRALLYTLEAWGRWFDANLVTLVEELLDGRELEFSFQEWQVHSVGIRDPYLQVVPSISNPRVLLAPRWIFESEEDDENDEYDDGLIIEDVFNMHGARIDLTTRDLRRHFLTFTGT